MLWSQWLPPYCIVMYCQKPRRRFVNPGLLFSPGCTSWKCKAVFSCRMMPEVALEYTLPLIVHIIYQHKNIAKEGQHIAQHWESLSMNWMQTECGVLSHFLVCHFSSHVQPPQPHPPQILLLKITGSIVMMCPNLSDPFLSSFLLHLFVIICSCFF